MKEKTKSQLRKIRYQWVSFKKKWGRGMAMADQFFQIVRYESYATMLTIGLNSIGFNIPLKLVMIIIPFLSILLFVLGHIDQYYIKTWQEENKYDTFEVNPFFKEISDNLKEIKNKLK